MKKNKPNTTDEFKDAMEVEATTEDAPTKMDTTTNDNHPIDETPTPKANPYETLPNDDPISTKLVPSVYTTVYQHLSPTVKAAARKPFLGAYDEGDDYLHDSLAKLTKIMMRIKHSTHTLGSMQVALCLNPGHTTDHWFELITRFVIEGKDDTTIKNIISEDEYLESLVTIIRMANTPPVHLFPIKFSKTPATNMSRAWHGAVMTLGSHYAATETGVLKSNLKKDKSKKMKQKTLKQSFADQLESHQATQSPPLIAVATAVDTAVGTTDSGKPPAVAPRNPRTKNTTTPKPTTHTAELSASQRNHPSTRVTVMIKVTPEGKESASDVAIQSLKDMFTTVNDRDDRAILLPWKITDLLLHPAITNESNFPTTATTMRVYADKFRPKKGALWLKLHWASDNAAAHLVSGPKSDNSDWFDDNEAGAWLATVQQSDDPVPICDFLYSGGFTDTDHLQHAITVALNQLHPGRVFLFGIRTRKHKEITIDQSNGYRSWTMVENQLAHLEADRKQSKLLKHLLYKLFNTKPRAERPGGYNLRVLPDKTMTKHGNQGDRTRHDTLRKHQGVILNLQLVVVEDVVDGQLDCPFSTNNGESQSLRQYIQNMQYPLSPKEDETPTPLFHSVDWASSGPDAGKAILHLTAYKDRFQTADLAASILPALITRDFCSTAAAKWFTPQGIENSEGITFLNDDDGNWLGTWTTPEDEINQALLDEDMGVAFDLSDMAFDEGHIGPIRQADDITIASHGTEFGRHAPPEPPQVSAATTPTGDATVVMDGSGDNN